MAYFSDREKGPAQRNIEEITPEAWRGLWAIVVTRLQNNSFAHAFPEQCRDGYGVCGVDNDLFEATLHGHGIVWPISKDTVPDTAQVMDLLEFCEEYVAQPIEHDYHDFFRHHHLSFKVEEGKAEFRKSVNTVLARNGLAFEMDDDGIMTRLGPPELVKVLKGATFNTGDAHLDELLEDAREKFMDPNLKIRKEALEKIWDAFERLKTIEAGKDKKATVAALLAKAITDADLRELDHMRIDVVKGALPVIRPRLPPRPPQRPRREAEAC
jgi:hypothetical protein